MKLVPIIWSFFLAAVIMTIAYIVTQVLHAPSNIETAIWIFAGVVSAFYVIVGGFMAALIDRW